MQGYINRSNCIFDEKDHVQQLLRVFKKKKTIPFFSQGATDLKNSKNLYQSP